MLATTQIVKAASPKAARTTTVIIGELRPQARLGEAAVELTLSTQSELGVANSYRVVGVESRVHRGTRERWLLET